MASCKLASSSFFIILTLVISTVDGESNFDDNFMPLWGTEHLSVVNQHEVHLTLDNSSGSGFRSKLEFGSGVFSMRMKLPDKPSESPGIITSFYLTSADPKIPDAAAQPHDEVDIEFFGTKGKLSTNIFVNDLGHREQVFQLWYDPSKEIHSYQIFWNDHQIVFFIDSLPIRVFKNRPWVANYTSKPMHIEASIWNADWAGNVSWSEAPFVAEYQGFAVDGCEHGKNNYCSSPEYYWNAPSLWQLTPDQDKQRQNARKTLMTFDYCSIHADVFPECSFNN